MDPEELRKSLIEEVKRSARKEEQAEIARLRGRLFTEARRIAARYRSIGHGPEHRKLGELYTRIDELIRAFNQAASIPDEDEQSKENKRLRMLALDIIETLRRVESSEARKREKIEEGRKRVVDRGKAGAGANTQRRIRDELNYLLRNYTPANDNKIETLIDKWRRSGDPQYDPMIKVRYRSARKKNDASNNPI